MERRNWVPDVSVIADQLIRDFEGGPEHGWEDVLATIEAWMDTTKVHGDEWQEDDWVALVQELVRRTALAQALAKPISPEVTDERYLRYGSEVPDEDD